MARTGRPAPPEARLAALRGVCPRERMVRGERLEATELDSFARKGSKLALGRSSTNCHPAEQRRRRRWNRIGRRPKECISWRNDATTATRTLPRQLRTNYKLSIGRNPVPGDRPLRQRKRQPPGAHEAMEHPLQLILAIGVPSVRRLARFRP